MGRTKDIREAVELELAFDPLVDDALRALSPRCACGSLTTH